MVMVALFGWRSGRPLLLCAGLALTAALASCSSQASTSSATALKSWRADLTTLQSHLAASLPSGQALASQLTALATSATTQHQVASGELTALASAVRSSAAAEGPVLDASLAVTRQSAAVITGSAGPATTAITYARRHRAALLSARELLTSAAAGLGQLGATQAGYSSTPDTGTAVLVSQLTGSLLSQLVQSGTSLADSAEASASSFVSSAATAGASAAASAVQAGLGSLQAAASDASQAESIAASSLQGVASAAGSTAAAEWNAFVQLSPQLNRGFTLVGDGCDTAALLSAVTGIGITVAPVFAACGVVAGAFATLTAAVDPTLTGQQRTFKVAQGVLSAALGYGLGSAIVPFAMSGSAGAISYWYTVPQVAVPLSKVTQYGLALLADLASQSPDLISGSQQLGTAMNQAASGAGPPYTGLITGAVQLTNAAGSLAGSSASLPPAITPGQSEPACDPNSLWPLVQAAAPAGFSPIPAGQTPPGLSAYCAGGWAELQGFPINAGSGSGLALFQAMSGAWQFQMFGDLSGAGAGYNECQQYPPTAVQALGTSLCYPPTGQFAQFVGIWQIYNTASFYVSTSGAGEVRTQIGCCSTPTTAQFQLTSVNTAAGEASGNVSSSNVTDLPTGPMTLTIIDDGNGLKFTPAQGTSFIGCTEYGMTHQSTNPGCP